MCLVPVDLGSLHSAVCEPDQRDTLQLSPPAGSELPLQAKDIPNPASNSNRLDVLDPADDLEVHEFIIDLIDRGIKMGIWADGHLERVTCLLPSKGDLRAWCAGPRYNGSERRKRPLRPPEAVDETWSVAAFRRLYCIRLLASVRGPGNRSGGDPGAHADMPVYQRGEGVTPWGMVVEGDFWIPDTLLWEPHLKTRDDGKAEVEIEIPGGIPALRVTTRGVAGADHFGWARACVPVSR